MQTIPFRHLRVILVSIVVLVLMILLTACSTGGISTGGNTGQSGPGTTGSAATTTATTPVSTTATQPATSTALPVGFKAGGISFIGPVKSINSSSLVMSAPNGQTYTLAINAQTDRSAYGASLPTVGSSVDMDSAINPDGSFTATILKPAQAGDPDLHNIAYTGITTSAVGADRVLHFTVGTKSYTFTIPATADLSDYSGNAQAIGNNAAVKVKIQYPANTVVSVGNAAA
ncbi:MAG TPA: hypothetical protein VFQ30_09090 [Ktedonobacteraceae bacterium]|nr:hypothetical protein [Ktedonobacteraceae bacterium]